MASRQGKIPARSFRIPEDEYQAAKAAAEKRGESLTDAVRRLLRSYARRN